MRNKLVDQNKSNNKILFLFFGFLLFNIVIGIIWSLQFLKNNNSQIEYYEDSLFSIPLIKSNTSIAIYTIFGAHQNLPIDLRGNFWEFQVQYFTGKVDLEYMSDGPLTVHGINKTIKCLVLPEGSSEYDDKDFCIRTPESWFHFAKFHSTDKWYFRGTHDTFINMTALAQVLNDLEKKYDPMKEFVFMFNFHEYGHVFYPHGGTGWLFSNYAVMKFAAEGNLFHDVCKGTVGDDVALTKYLEAKGFHIIDWQSPRFIVTYPNTELDIILNNQTQDIEPCSNGYKLSPFLQELFTGRPKTAVAIHMHRVPMNIAWKVLKQTPENFGVTFLNPNSPKFCRMTDQQIIASHQTH